MEDLKKKIQALTPDKAFYIYAGIPVLMLILFLFCTQVSHTESALGITGSLSMTGVNLMAGKATASIAGISKDMEGIKTGFTGIMAILYLISIIGVVGYGYAKKVSNYLVTLAPVVILFLIAVIGISDKESFGDDKLTGSVWAWIEIVIGLVWVAFAYFRGNNPIELKK